MVTKKRELVALVQKLKEDREKVKKEDPLGGGFAQVRAGEPTGWNPFEEVLSWLPEPVQKQIEIGLELVDIIHKPISKYIEEPAAMLMSGHGGTYPLPWWGMEEAHEKQRQEYLAEEPWLVREGWEAMPWLLANLPVKGVAKGAEMLRGAKVPKVPVKPKMPTVPTETVAMPETVPQASQGLQDAIRREGALAWREAERRGLSGVEYQKFVDSHIESALGGNPIIRLYRGVTTPRKPPTWEPYIEGQPGQYWSTDVNIARGTYARGGDVYYIDMKVSELANFELVSSVGERGTGLLHEYQLGKALQSKAKLLPTTPTETAVTQEGLTVKAELAGTKGAGAGKGRAQRAITIQETKALAGVGEQTPEALTEKLVKTIESAVPERVQTEILKSGELKRRVAAGARILEKGTGKKAFEKAKAPLAGELPKAEFTAPELSFSTQEIDGLFNIINKAELRFFSKLNTGEALTKVLTGQIPTKGEIWMLERIFGKAFGKALRAKGGRAGRWFEMALDIANIPRSFLAAYDLSAPLRQGALLLGQPREWAGALKPMVKAFGSEKYALQVDDIITSGENFIRREAAGLYHAPLSGPGARLSQREEAFISRIASKFPGIRHSERAYITFLNKIRADSFDNIIAGWERAGLKFGDNDIRELARFINYASGRGGLWKLEEAGPILSSLLFSPRLQMSRFQAPTMMLSSSPLVRKVAMRNFAAFFGSMTTIVTLAYLMGAKVELDPRSSDFGKIRIGNTRLDPWAGYQQYARYATQMITGYRKTTSTEKVVDVERGEVRDRFLRSKLSPAAGLLSDIVEGETFLGEELYEGPGSIGKAAKERLTPMFAQDMWDALEQEGLIGGVLALPGGLGWGVTAFEARKQEELGGGWEGLPTPWK